MSQPKSSLSTFALAMMNVAAVLSLRALPIMAETGLTMVFYLLFVSLFFLVPVSLIAAELATGWPAKGGVYRWVKEAFGPRWGFLAIWLQWVQNIIWYPIVLGFAADVLAYFFGKPALARSNIYTAAVVVIVYWGSTLITFRGLKVTSKVTSLGVLLGTLLPALLIIVLGIIWVLAGHPLAFMQVKQHWFPDFSHFSNIAFLASIVLLFAGMEINAVHVGSLEKPKKQYPSAIFIALLVTIIVFTIGSLSVATVLPAKQISLTAGIMQAFDKILTAYHLHWLLPTLGLFIAFGAMGGVMAWIAGPSKGLLETAKEGELPPFLAHTNSKGIQTHILIVQGIIITLLTSLYIIMPNVSNAFFLLSAMTVTLYLVMYFLLFAAGIRLRYTQPNVPRAYHVPGGKIGMWIIAGAGIITVIFAFIIGFFPPEKLHITKPVFYTSTVIAGLVIFIGAAFIIHAFKKPEWRKQ